MVLRKPYAFLIKHFKMLHLIMTILTAYLVYRSSQLTGFLNNYVSSTQNVIGQELTSVYVSTWMFIVPVLIIIVSLIVAGVLVVKKKPIMFYIVTIVSNIASTIIYSISFNTLESMELKLLDIRNVKLANDLMIFVLIFQIVVLIVTLIRATGFDIKKFNFNKDLQELDIDTSDNEEIEVELKINTDKLKRNTRRKFRFLRYFYVENIFLINVIGSVLLIVTIFYSFFNITVLNKTYKQSATFRAGGFSIKINDVYVTDKDFNGNIIDSDLQFVVINFNVRSTQNIALPISRASIIVNNTRYYHQYNYKTKFKDLGNAYNDEKINGENEYLLVFQIPRNTSIKKLTFSYIDQLLSNGLNPKYIKVTLAANYINGNVSTKNYNLKDTIDFKDSLFKESELIINNYEIADYFKENYIFVSNKNPYKSVEYIRKSIETSDTRTLLKLKYNLKMDSNYVLNKLDLVTLLRDFGKIQYEIEGKKIIDNLTLKQVIPTKFKTSDIYLEVSKDIVKASKIDFIFNIRNKTYVYNLKGGSV